MNKKRAGELRLANELLEKAVAIIDRITDDEADCYDNMPENLKNGENAVTIEDNIDKLDSARSDVWGAIETISSVLH